MRRLVFFAGLDQFYQPELCTRLMCMGIMYGPITNHYIIQPVVWFDLVPERCQSTLVNFCFVLTALQSAAVTDSLLSFLLQLRWIAFCYSRPRGLTFTWWEYYELAHSFLFCSCVYFCLYGPFNCISFHKFSQRLSVFSLCYCGPSCLIGPFNSWLTGLKAPTN